jgi:predicted ATP-grasp superfamily ATP-dependent carboligase
LPADLVLEAAAMLQAVLADFAALGSVYTITTLDARLEGMALPADCVMLVPPRCHAAAFASALAGCDAALVIAPETGGILADLSARVLAAGVPLLGSDPEAIRLTGDKWACQRRWQAAGVPAPATRLAQPAFTRPVARAMGYPIVAKPVDGVGCAGVALARDESELAAAVATAAAAGAGQQPILLQRYVHGNHASAALLVVPGQAIVLSLNSQDVREGSPFRYCGGAVPLIHPGRDTAVEVARAAALAIPGLKGYVGVDLVLAGEDAWAIELNPRLTTSYVGLRRVTAINLAEAIYTACTRGVLPLATALHGQVSFDKDGAISRMETT